MLVHTHHSDVRAADCVAVLLHPLLQPSSASSGGSSDFRGRQDSIFSARRWRKIFSHFRFFSFDFRDAKELRE
jgi:hypothetical protein